MVQNNGSKTAELAGMTGSNNLDMKIEELKNPRLKSKDKYLIYNILNIHE